MKFPVGLVIASSALALVAANSATAATLVVPVTTIGSSSYPGYDASNATDQGAGSDVSDWASFSDGINSYLRLDLGSTYSLANVYATDRVTSGGGNNGFHGGLSDFTTSFTLQAFSDATFGTSISALYTFNKTAPVGPTSASDFAFVGATPGLTGRYILYSVTGTGGSNPGLSNLAFGAVPEPATWGMMLFGFAAMGGAMRYRRRETKVRFA
ncbi:MAG: hypothetical protein JWR80_3178 [Bradyrhizobium sp.]|nr:hypothetical protein [Bradyrhizobium sp.]